MKQLIYFLMLTTVACLFQTTIAQQSKDRKEIPLTDEEKKKYIGEYVIEVDNVKKSRQIIIKEDKLYYVVDSKMHIPLKPESKTKFNLYPSATYLYFEFDSEGEVIKLLIKKGSGGTLHGKKIK